MKTHYILFIIVCLLCMFITIVGFVYPLDLIFVRIKELAFTLSLFLVAIIDFFKFNKKREFKGYLFLIVSSLAFILSLYDALVTYLQ